METVKADSYKRVRLPDVKPGQVFAYADNGNGCITLTLVKPDTKEAFPKGSLAKYVDEMNKDWAGAKGMKVPTPPKDWE